jgi:PAS domain S-box-containing protein
VHKTEHGYVGVAIEISKKIERQKEAERKILSSKKFFQNVLESIPDPIFVKDRKHRWIEGNKAFFDMFGLPKEEVLGKSDYDFFGKEEADIFWQKDNEVFESEGVLDNFETFTQHDETRTFFTRKVVVNDVNGEKILIGAIRDVTDLEKIRKELTRSNEELERFAYIASHDLQEPLRMVTNFTRLLKERYHGKLDADADSYIEFSFEAANRMAEMVDDLLDYSRLNEPSAYKHNVNCNDIIKYVEKNLSESIRVSNAKIICPEKLPILDKANPVRLTRLFQNLVSNSIKYRRPNIAPEIVITFEEKKKVWKFIVSDNGIGISEKYFERIFYPFKRLHTREEYSGSGLGLSACKKIVENFGGKISVSSIEGKGSAFSFTHPKDINWRNDK